MYQIQYLYQTGDSFGSHDADGILELEWENLDVAKANLKRIKEHYEMYRRMNSYYEKLDKFQLTQENASKDWLAKEVKLGAYDHGQFERAIDKQNITLFEDRGFEVKEFFDPTIAENCIVLYTDKGKPFQFWCPWCGYFETLHTAKIIKKNPIDNDMEINF